MRFLCKCLKSTHSSFTAAFKAIREKFNKEEVELKARLQVPESNSIMLHLHRYCVLSGKELDSGCMMYWLHVYCPHSLCEALPFEQVLDSALHHPPVQNFLHHIFFLFLF